MSSRYARRPPALTFCSYVLLNAAEVYGQRHGSVFETVLNCMKNIHRIRRIKIL